MINDTENHYVIGEKNGSCECAIVKCQKSLVIKKNAFVVSIRKPIFYCGFNISELNSMPVRKSFKQTRKSNFFFFIFLF